jgi:hypothetical protein
MSSNFIIKGFAKFAEWFQLPSAWHCADTESGKPAGRQQQRGLQQTSQRLRIPQQEQQQQVDTIGTVKRPYFDTLF